MDVLNALSSASGAPTADAAPTAPRSQSDLGQGDFLKLMIQQMQNQDPLAPMESGDFLGQIAQFGTVSGIQALQGSFAELASAMTANQALRGSELLDRDVLIEADRARLPEGGTLGGLLELPATANEVVVEITGANGERVRRLELGRLPGGSNSFSFDGIGDSGRALPGGDYGITATARIDGTTEQVPVLVRARVLGIEMQPGTGALRLDVGAERSIDLAAVRRID